MNKAIWTKVRLFVYHAHNKLTTYVGLLIASAAEIRNQWPDLTAQIPHSAWLNWLEGHAFVGLGFLVVYARIRRLMSPPA
jgi:threonine/homoserine/homoserine lactone efflux protein